MITPTKLTRTLASATRDTLTPVVAAYLVNELTKYEKTTGGPYLPPYTLKDQLFVNFHAIRLFGNGTPLTGAEAFLKKYSYTAPTRTNTTIPTPPNSNTQLYKTVHSLITSTLGEHAELALGILKSIQETDTSGEISGLSAEFFRALSDSSSYEASTEQYDLANILTWTAYSLYDSVYDHPTPKIKAIPIANILNRLALSSLGNTNSSIARDVFTQMDLAHITEITIARFNRTSTPSINTAPSANTLQRLLSERSIAHCVGPLLLAAELGQDTLKLKASLGDYCAARQLLDDIHDWKEDFMSGKWTYVTAHLARKAHVKTGAPLRESLHQMQRAFWETEAEHLLKQGQLLVSRSKRHAVFNAQGFYKITIGRLENSIAVNRANIQNARLLTKSIYPVFA